MKIKGVFSDYGTYMVGVYRIIKFVVAFFKHLNLIDAIICLIVFCHSGFSTTLSCSALLEQKSIPKCRFKKLL